MPRFLYLVTAHSNPAQQSRLIAALLSASPEGQILLHVDPTATGAALPAAYWAGEPRVHLHPAPQAVRWADFSLIEVVLAAAAWARAQIPFDWLVWISGQDYPLGTLDAFEAQLAGGTADGWMRHFPSYTHHGWPAGEGLRRYGYAYRDVPSFPRFYWFPAAVRRAILEGIRLFDTAQSLVQLRPRHRNNSAKLGLRLRHTPYSSDFPCVGGWSWFNLNARAVARLLDFVAARPDYVAHYRRCYCPDESFFHTILVNDPELEIANDSLRHVCWEDRPYPSNAGTITRGPLFDAALASGMPFARKFDLDVDAGCLDELDVRILAGARRRTGTPA